jgi:pSer/pThr/pTyr-binding forkhead associated (FHA) protein
MPFSIKEDAAAQVTTDDSNQGSTVEEDEDIKDVIPEDISESENQNGWVLYAIIAAAVILGAAIVFLIVMLVKKNKGKSGNKKNNNSNAAPIRGEGEYQRTMLLDTPPKQESRNTVRMTPGGAADQPKRYRFILTDTADSSRSFRCELVDQINIGRQPDNSIVISDDTTVHGHQAIVSVENDVFKYTDLKSVQNHSSVDGVKISAGIPKLIITNTKITIGRHTYVVSIQKQ